MGIGREQGRVNCGEILFEYMMLEGGHRSSKGEKVGVEG